MAEPRSDEIVVGIDLGTTFSAVAWVDEQGTPRVIQNAAGQSTTPSVVLIEEDGRVAVGEVALNQWIARQERVVRWIKRAMGDNDYRFQGRSAVEISAEILKTLVAEAGAELGQPLGRALVTCPAYFASTEIENTRKAGELAGLEVREIVKEPTAAAVHYGVEHMREGERLLVCDLGGGTFDATVLSYQSGVFTPLASMGDRMLGGHDWTMDLVELASERWQALAGSDPRDDLIAAQVLYERCEQAKRDFARVPEVLIACTVAERTEQIQLRREDFEARTEWRIEAVVGWAEAALSKAGLGWGQIDTLLLVGGSARLRRLAPVLEAHSGKTPVLSREPDLAVALGAAIMARGAVRARRGAGLAEARRPGLVAVQYKRIIPRSLGTRVIQLEQGRARIVTSLIIAANTECPVRCSREDYELAAGQTAFDVPVVEFESEEQRDTTGNFRFTAAPAPKPRRIRVEFDYDASAQIVVRAYDRDSGAELAGERLPFHEPDPEKISAGLAKPRWVVFALDHSGSMEGKKLKVAKKEIRAKAAELLALGASCRVGLVGFSNGAATLCAPTAELRELERALDAVQAEGGTAMDLGIREALSAIQVAPEGTSRDVVMVTDGMPNDARRALEAAAELTGRGVALANLGVGNDDVDLAFLKQLSPNSLVIGKVEEMAGALGTLLFQQAAAGGRP